MFESCGWMVDGYKYMSFGSICLMNSGTWEYQYSFEKCLALLWATPFFEHQKYYESMYAFFEISFGKTHPEIPNELTKYTETFCFDFSNLKVRNARCDIEISSGMPLEDNTKDNTKELLLLHFIINRNPGKGYIVENIIFPSFNQIKRQLINIHSLAALRILDSIPVCLHLEGKFDLYMNLYNKYKLTGIEEVVSYNIMIGYSVKYNRPRLLADIVNKYNVKRQTLSGIHNISKLTMEELIFKNSESDDFEKLKTYKKHVDYAMVKGCVVFNSDFCVELPVNSLYLLLFISLNKLKASEVFTYSFTPDSLINMVGQDIRVIKSRDIEYIVLNP